MTVGGMLAVVLKPSKMRYSADRSLTKTRVYKASLTGVLSVALAVFFFMATQVAAVFLSRNNVVFANEQTLVIPAGATISAQKTPIDAAKIQDTVTAWAKKYSGHVSVTIQTSDGKTIASSDQQRQYFTASIYKLYVAYLASQDIDAGIHTPTEPFLNAYTRADCLTRMIQFSDSPCAEKMMAELGKQNMQTRLHALGLTDTSMARLQTSTKDASLVTGLVNKGTGLSPQSTERLRTAMLHQQYRDALPKGFTGFEVGDKVGFYEVGYHDTAFVKAPNSDSFIVTIFTDAVRSSSITELSQKLAPLLKNS